MKLKSEELRQQILQAATELIIKDGIGGTSTVKVAKKIKMSQSNIYSYFKSRQDLLLAVFEYHQQQIIASLEPMLDDQLTPQQQISVLIQEMIEFGKQHFETVRILSIFRSQPNMRTVLPRVADDEFFTRLFQLISQYQDAGIIKPVNAEFLMEGAFSIITDYLIAIIAGELTSSEVSGTDVVDLINDYMLARR